MLARRQMLRQLTSREVHIQTGCYVRIPDEMETFVHLFLNLSVSSVLIRNAAVFILRFKIVVRYSVCSRAENAQRRTVPQSAPIFLG